VARFDGLVVATVALGISFSVRQRLSWSAVMLGLGGSLKLWPLLLVPSIAATCFPNRIIDRVMMLAKCGTIALLSFLIAHFVCVWIGTLPTDMFGY